MKEWDIPVDNASIKQQQREVLIGTKEKFMKLWNILLRNVIIKQHQKEI